VGWLLDPDVLPIQSTKGVWELPLLLKGPSHLLPLFSFFGKLDKLWFQDTNNEA